MAITPGKGTVFQIEISSTLTTVGQNVSIGYSGLSMGTVPTTHLGSAAATIRPTIVDGGEFSLDFFYDPADSVHTYLTTACLAGTEESMALSFPDSAGSITFNGFILGLDLDGIEVEGNVSGKAKIKVNGLPTFA